MTETKDKIKVLFLCIGNSCRSQIAEGWAEYLKRDSIEVYSAGICPSGLNSRAIRVMAEDGVDISTHTSKHFDELLGIDFDYGVTLCDKAREQWPVFGCKTKQVHRAFEDPTLVVGSEEQIMAAFRMLRDDIRAFIETMHESLRSQNC